jgi:ATP-binding cassette subfamily A (ABC1) protein 2
MLTGDTPITKGDAIIHGCSVRSELYSAFHYIGYCPQFDALYDELTAREHLNLYATLRGVLKNSRSEVVDWALTKLDLLQYADRPVGTYSGGNKRKLSTAIALIGGPALIFLDEPTTGMDPYSKRFLWDLILSLVKDGKSIVFTSHSMEECEMLCTRLAIMVNGHFKCLGSTQHLKNKFGDGYSIKIKCLESDTTRMETYMKKNFPFAVLAEKHYNCLHYELNSQYVFLDDVFSKMELAMKQVFIKDYSVSQNTLDNVFINFVKDQNDQHEMPQASLAEPEMSSDDDFDDAILENSDNSSGNSDTLPNGIGELLPDIVP